VLEITDRAASAIQTIVALQSVVDSEVPISLARICPGVTSPVPDGAALDRVELRLDLVAEPDPGDEVVSGPDGAQVWIAASVVPVLENKVLDSEPDARGWPTFVFWAA
jgi:Fe-S cluster assembly iron-binding protein IscA